MIHSCSHSTMKSSKSSSCEPPSAGWVQAFVGCGHMRTAVPISLRGATINRHSFQRIKALYVWFVCDAALANAARKVFYPCKHGAPTCSSHPTDGENLASLGSRETKRSSPGKLRCCPCKQCPIHGHHSHPNSNPQTHQ